MHMLAGLIRKTEPSDGTTVELKLDIWFVLFFHKLVALLHHPNAFLSNF